ncbi:MAG TPA: C25 family cysteine peptidase, partial [Flavobacteriales bacterium]|nr:C25 family cysteine peptidase [Flavobacteriales bacterium]
MSTRSLLSWADGWMRDGERNDLPFIHETKALVAGTTSFSAYLTETRYVALTSAEQALLPGLGEVPADVEVHTSLGFQRKMPLASVDIYPYRRNAGTGQVERLSAYTLEVVEVHGGANGHAKSATYPSHSKLANGEWYRFTVAQDGVYKLSYAFLEQLGVNVSGLTSDRINIYGNHEGQLPYKNSPFHPTDLELNAIEVVDGNDGQFGPDDYVLFYASDAQRWDLNAAKTRYVHTKNVYTDSASYFVGIDAGDLPKRIADRAQTSDPATDQVTSFNDRQVIDRDYVNMLKSGRTFFAETFDLVTNYSYSFQVPFLHAGDSLFLTTEVMAHSIDASSSFRVEAAGVSTTFTVPSVGDEVEDPYGALRNVTLGLPSATDPVVAGVTFIKHDPITSLGYMNFLELNARRDLKMVGTQLLFRDLKSAGAGRVGAFTLDLAADVQQIWEVTDPTDVGRIAFVANGTQKTFRLATDSVREFIAFKSTGLLEPTAIGPVENQDLHATALPADLVIVTAPQFMSDAQRLGTRRAAEGLSVVIVTPQQVFNEFSSGQRDATAIKRYMKMLYDRAGADPALMPRYLLLFGDGSYNNILLTASNQNFIPTYQTAEALAPLGCYTSDDYFGLLDDNEGEASNEPVDIGIGRFPVSDATQAARVVDKLLNYDRLTLNSTTASTCTAGNDGGS